MDTPKEPIIVIRYEQSKNASTFPVTGAHGGPTCDGRSLMVHLYTEYSTLPSTIEVPVEAGGKVNLVGGKPIARSDVTREVQSSMVLSAEAAAAIGQFLIDQAKKLKDQ